MHHVSELMIDTVFTLQPSDTLNDARTLMKLAKIRNTPVTGIIAQFKCTESKIQMYKN